MVVDGHFHIAGDWRPVLERMDALGIDRTVLVGVGVRDLGAITIRDSVVFRCDLLFRTVGMWKARRLAASRRLRDVLLPNPVNDRVLEAIAAQPGRFSGFAFVNPLSPAAVPELRRCLGTGMCGIKLALLQYPADLTGPEIRSICAVAREFRVPVFFHVGLTRAASDFAPLVRGQPDVRFIIAHAGVQCFEAAVRMARQHANVFIDTSSYIVTHGKLTRMIREVGPEKLVFGSDVPVMCRDAGDALAKIRRLPLAEPERKLILGENMRRLLP